MNTLFFARANVFVFFIVFTIISTFTSCFPVPSDEDFTSTDDGSGSLTLSIRTAARIPDQQIPMAGSTRASSISDFCSRLQLAVFQGDQRVKNLSQTSADANFGNLTLRLDPGDYQLVILAHSGLGNATISTPEKVTFKDNKVTDTFLYYTSLSLSESTELEAVLHRVVAAFRLVITEPIPADVSSLKFYYTGGSSTLDATTGFGCVQSKQTEYRDISTDLIGISQTLHTIFTFPHEDPDQLNINVKALDADGNTLFEQQFDGYQIRPNYITQHSDPFFQSTQSNITFAPSIYNDGAWAGTTQQ